MNFARAVKGPMTRGQKLNPLHAKAEVELGGKLSNEEISSLSRRFSLDYVLDTSEKVRLISYQMY